MFRLFINDMVGKLTEIKLENNMACQQATFTDAKDLATFIAQLVQIGCEFDVVQTKASLPTGSAEWVVDLS